MKLLVNKKIVSDVLNKLGIDYIVAGETSLQGYEFRIKDNGNFYIEPGSASSDGGIIVELDEKNMWKLDNFQNVFKLSRRQFPDNDGEWYAYFEREGAECFSDTPMADMHRYLGCERQLNMCDIFMLIPGKIRKKDSKRGEDNWDKLIPCRDEIGENFIKCMSDCIRGEYDNNFNDSLERKCLGEVRIEIASDFSDGQSYTQTASLEIVKHETGICIVELLVPNCYIGGNKLLNYYCGDVINYIYRGERLTLDELMSKRNIRPFGKKRSMVFTHKSTPDREIINALANEENPMAEINGILSEKLKSENIAQYGTAEVYVSTVSMVERCNDIKSTIEERMPYAVLEIFFVELLLFQDAAIDKIYKDLQREQSMQEKKQRSAEKAIEKYEQISFDMSQALKFSDYEHFNFPTTRVSAKKVAENFGIEYVHAKYETNKEILSSMIEANKRNKSEKENKIKNTFLFFLSALAALSTAGEVINGIMSTDNTAMGYIIAAITITVFYLAYIAVLSVYRLINHIFTKRHHRR